MVGVLTGPAYDAGYFRLLVGVGSLAIPLGFMMLSLCKTYWQILLAQAFLIGMGNGCLFVPSVAILPQWFSTRKALANGIAASGSSIGGIIYPIVFRQLYPQIGFGWTVRVMGFLSLATCAFSFSVMRPRVFPTHKRHLTDLGAFKEAPYTLFNIAMAFGFMGFYGPIYYVSLNPTQEVHQAPVPTVSLFRLHSRFLVSSTMLKSVTDPAVCYSKGHYRCQLRFLSPPNPKRSICFWANLSKLHDRHSRPIQRPRAGGIDLRYTRTVLDRHQQQTGHDHLCNSLWIFQWRLRITSSCGISVPD